MKSRVKLVSLRDMLFQHPTSTALVNRTTLWGSAVNDMPPDYGEEYFTKVSADYSERWRY